MLAIQAQVGGPPAHVLDLVAAPQGEAGATAADALEIPGGLLPLNHRDLSPSLRLHLESIEPMDLAGGEPVVYQITIENVGRTSVQLPWSPTNEGLKRTMPGSTVGVLSLAAAAMPNLPGDIPVVSQPLYGAPQVAESLITLEPGEYARVRVRGHWTLQAQIRERVGQDRTIRLVGTLMLYLPTGTGQVRSVEEVTVHLTRRTDRG